MSDRDDGEAGWQYVRLWLVAILVTAQHPLRRVVHLQGATAASREFYDFERIRSELEHRGHVFRTRSDSEIALHLFEEQARALHSLRGEFAFAIWDERDGTLFAARDRFGIKPMYYTIHNGVFYLASEVKAFIELGVPLRWDLETLYDVQFFGHAPDRSPFAGIYQLPPGCYLLTDGQHVRVMPYWDWDFPLATNAAPVTDERAYVERVRHALEEAVRLRLRGDVPVACYLSGGIDSCAILGLASRLSSKPLRAYTLSFDHAVRAASGYAAGSLVDGPGIYDRRKVVALLDSVPSMDPATRTRADTLLMWVLSLCLLHDRLGMSSGAVARAA